MAMKRPRIDWMLVLLLIPMLAGAAPLPLTDDEAAFLAGHWRDPIAPQGLVPAGRSPVEASLAPKDCGTCHVQQYADWQTSLHSKSMGPGVLGQVVDMVDNDPGTAQVCWRCHTPLAEQQDVLFQAGEGWQRNAKFDSALQGQGLICAGCHVRGQQRFGPPRKGAAKVSGAVTDAGLPHGGFVAQTAFEKSAFCKGCHQFTADGYALNGKLLENTYEEWLASSYPQQGVQCQDCHMPDRRHLWRGIHDPEMVRRAIRVNVDAPARPLRSGETLQVGISVANVGAGHYFPTYVTPKVTVQAVLLDEAGAPLPASLQEAVIGREVSLDLSQELFDTRIAPGDTRTLSYVQDVPTEGLRLRVRVEVDPDHFYARFYQATLAADGADKGKAMLQQALDNALAGRFVVFEKIFGGTTAAKVPTANAEVDGG